MIQSALIGAVTGMRSMTPLAAITGAARDGVLPADDPTTRLLADPLVGAGAMVMATLESVGDKWRKAPDRIVAAGMVARIATASIAGAAVAPRGQRGTAVLVGVAAAVVSSYLSFHLRMAALRRFGQVPTGIVEDLIAVAGAAYAVRPAPVR